MAGTEERNQTWRTRIETRPLGIGLTVGLVIGIVIVASGQWVLGIATSRPDVRLEVPLGTLVTPLSRDPRTVPSGEANEVGCNWTIGKFWASYSFFLRNYGSVDDGVEVIFHMDFKTVSTRLYHVPAGSSIWEPSHVLEVSDCSIHTFGARIAA